MKSWWKSSNGDYFNPDLVDALFAFNNSGTWELRVSIGAEEFSLNGTYANAAAAREVARRLTQGFDPATLA